VFSIAIRQPAVGWEAQVIVSMEVEEVGPMACLKHQQQHLADQGVQAVRPAWIGHLAAALAPQTATANPCLQGFATRKHSSILSYQFIREPCSFAIDFITTDNRISA
jgi:hypothetical protein